MTRPSESVVLVERLTADVYPFSHDFDTIAVPAGVLRRARAAIEALHARIADLEAKVETAWNDGWQSQTDNLFDLYERDPGQFATVVQDDRALRTASRAKDADHG